MFQVVPTGFIPAQDKQYLVGIAQLPDAASLDRTEDVIRAHVATSRCSSPASQTPSQFPGLSINGFTEQPERRRSCSSASKPFEERTSHGAVGLAIAAAAQQRSSARSRTRSSSCSRRRRCRAWARSAASSCSIEDRADLGYDALYKATQAVLAEGAPDAGAARACSPSYQINVPQLDADVDRVKAKQQGVPLTDVFETMQVYLGSLYVNDFNRFGRTYQVIAQADAPFRAQAEDILRAEDAQRRGRDGAARLARARSTRPTGPDRVQRYNGYPAADINGGPAPGYQLRPGAGGDREASSQRDAAERHDVRMDRADVPADPRGQHRRLRVPAVRAARVPRARRAVRELDAAARDHPDRADVPARRAIAGVLADAAATTTSSRRSA